MSSSSTGPAEKVIQAARKLLHSLVNSGETRLRLAVIELQEERARLFSLLILTGIGIMLVAFGIGMLMLLVIVAFWQEHRLLAIGIASGILLLLGLLVLLRVRAISREPSLLRSTLARFSEDKQLLDEYRIDHDKVGEPREER
ncbi:phage holin family protein [Kushneria aurantia]|uniref:Phage holin family protein n=1 Tax=Kushneria aurantia TaxID=504092 RepID=A0ABV6G8D1_9GAMM|nr:phage holin family protein [Kushneria aurantia]